MSFEPMELQPLARDCLALGLQDSAEAGTVYLFREVNLGTSALEKTMTKSVALALTLAAALLAPAGAYAKPSEQGCKSSDGKAKGCDNSKPVPEAGDIMLLSAGLASVSALSLVRRKGQNK
jgi:hypothetical protein